MSRRLEPVGKPELLELKGSLPCRVRVSEDYVLYCTVGTPPPTLSGSWHSTTTNGIGPLSLPKPTGPAFTLICKLGREWTYKDEISVFSAAVVTFSFPAKQVEGALAQATDPLNAQLLAGELEFYLKSLLELLEAAFPTTDSLRAPGALASANAWLHRNSRCLLPEASE